MRYTRYWFEFDASRLEGAPFAEGARVGVTAESLDAAKRIIADKIFRGRELPPTIRVVEDVDVSTLDAGHVLPNMGVCCRPGIWFPLGYD